MVSCLPSGHSNNHQANAPTHKTISITTALNLFAIVFIFGCLHSNQHTSGSCHATMIIITCFLLEQFCDQQQAQGQWG